MPELPEVETIRRQLEKAIVNKKLNGKKIIGVGRKGKMLIVDFSGKEALVFHLKLTGQLLFNVKPSLYTREVFKFNDGSCLVFNDARKFGWWKKVKDPLSMKEIKQLGPDALEISEKDFASRLAKRKQVKIKPLLMDQKFVAGIGNIYADEILFDAKVKPDRKAGGLTGKETKAVFESMKKILKAAIKAGGSSVRDYVDAGGRQGGFVKYHKVYQKTGQKCQRCPGAIRRIKLGGRSAHYCPECQK
ncbi:MAG: bifunctional DNA-formamidopyrimidine glycosylase/DNA-(apurinic or apyrimidinic site) lyase [Patescibacteria group bacterium]|nr:bifunctional DNA-formamidopyrimidine glycosylase/DNA-(apurinic or apyrimidinic site) lyase [Patescibacteria group bacterium]